ncbi:MAG TPA: FAD-dependent oxidoreductase, partial [Magnetospirillum sp.]|nr:FAD-dependent oxidoreductase [Magnetospirillum sp.]
MSYDLLVIGSGAAGLSLALRVLAAKPAARVAVLAKGPLSEGSTMYAQGGIAAVLDAADSTESHLADTLNAGGGLCNVESVRFVVENARSAIEWLI